MNSVIQIGTNIAFIYQGKVWWKGSKEKLIKSEKSGSSYSLSNNQVNAILELRLQKLTSMPIKPCDLFFFFYE